MTNKECMGVWNFLNLDSIQKTTRCGNNGIYRSDKGFYLCKNCGESFLDKVGRIKKVR